MTDNKDFDKNDEMKDSPEISDNDKSKADKDNLNAVDNDGEKIESNLKTEAEKSPETDKEVDDLSDIAMIKCPRCGNDTPKSVRSCIYCGYNLVDKPYIGMDKKKTRIIKWAIGIPLLILFFIWFFLTKF